MNETLNLLGERIVGSLGNGRVHVDPAAPPVHLHKLHRVSLLQIHIRLNVIDLKSELRVFSI